MSTDEQAAVDAPGRSWVEVRGGALRRNFRRIRDSVGAASAIIPMVKADAYGLGMEAVVQALEPEGPWGYGVATVEEGARLRAGGVVKPVVIVSPLPPEAYDLAVAEALTPTLSEVDALDRLAASAERLGREARFHVEIDTGMGRSGFDWRRIGEWGPALAERLSDPLVWEGCYTHFHSADVAGDHSTSEQWRRFREALDGLTRDGPAGDGATGGGPTRGGLASGAPAGRGVGLIHACNGAAALRYPSLAADAVRPGIFLYGGAVGAGVAPPDEVVQLRARVTLIREVPEGTTLGYGATYRAGGSERWATLGIGYGDGLPRILGNRGSALLSGRRVPIVGRISMDLTVVDISGIDGVMVGDTGTLIGTDGEARITVDEVAVQAGTISYEILTGLTSRLPRIWTGAGGDR